MGQRNLVGRASSSPKELAHAVSTHLLKGTAGGSNPTTLLMDALKNLSSDRFKSTMIGSLKLDNDSSFIVPATVIDINTTNAKGITSQFSSNEQKPHDKGRKLSLQCYEMCFEIDGRKVCVLQRVIHAIKCVRNSTCHKGNISCFSKLESSNRFVLEE